MRDSSTPIDVGTTGRPAPGKLLRIAAAALPAGALAALVLAVYSPVLEYGFIALDDGLYVTGNPNLAGGSAWETIRWAFSSLYASNWHPLTWISHWIDLRLFGQWAGGHHLVNVLLHAGVAVALLATLTRMTGARWPAAAVAFTFALHPLRVESVAWVAERKDTLSALLWVLAVAAYLRHLRRPSARRYLAVAVTFALALMAKPMAVTLPAILLLLDWWPLGRWAVPRPAPASGESGPVSAGGRRLAALLWEKAPLFLMAASSSAVTLVAQARGQALLAGRSFPLSSRAVNALNSYAAYLGKLLWPSDLAIFYPRPAGPLPWKPGAVILLAMAALTWLLWRGRARAPYLFAGWLWYAGMLIPVIGLVTAGNQAMADRYTYLPSIGLLVAAAWGVRRIVPARPWRTAALGAAAAAVLASLALAARLQVGRWRDDVAIFEQALRVTPGDPVLADSLGLALAKAGRSEEALARFREAVSWQPDYAEAWGNMANVRYLQGHAEEAVELARKALALKPGQAMTRNNLGVYLLRLGRRAEAAEEFRRALDLDPGLDLARRNLEGMAPLPR